MFQVATSMMLTYGLLKFALIIISILHTLHVDIDMYLYYIYTLCSAIMEAGGDLGIGHAGTRVINTLRIEKGEEACRLS